MTRLDTTLGVDGPWSLETSRRFWEGFSPNRIDDQPDDALRVEFLEEATWSPAVATVRQRGAEAEIRVETTGGADLDAAAVQVSRFLAIDVDATAWPEVGRRDPVIARAQAAMPGLRPCGFLSPYEAAAWSVLSQRVRITQAATLRERLVAEHGRDGAFPDPATLRSLSLGLPGRKDEYLAAVADAALEGDLSFDRLRGTTPDAAMNDVQRITGIGPFAAELIVLRGANAPDGMPRNEDRLRAEIDELYGPGTDLVAVSEAWRPLRTWAAVHLRAQRELRTGEIARGRRAR